MHTLKLPAACLVLIATANVAIGQGNASLTVGPLELTNCLVTVINDVQVPAHEAGPLKTVEVLEGTLVRAESLLALIDDSRAQKQKQVAEYELRVAHKQAEDDIDVRYQVMRSKVAQKEWQLAEEANIKISKTIPETQIEKLKLSYDSSLLAIDRAKRDLEVAGLNRDLAAVKLQASEEEIDRRRVKAPFDGVVARIYRKAGEWVAPGDPILRLVQMNTLRVEGFVKATDRAPHEVFGKPVTIKVELARGLTKQFEANIGYVSPDIEATGEFRVWAKITNFRDRDNNYLVRPGSMATMTIMN